MRVRTGRDRAGTRVFAPLAATVLAVAVFVAPAADAVAQTQAQRLKLLEQTVKELLARDEARERKMKAMEAELKRLRGGRGLATVGAQGQTGTRRPRPRPRQEAGRRQGKDGGRSRRPRPRPRSRRACRGGLVGPGRRRGAASETPRPRCRCRHGRQHCQGRGHGSPVRRPSRSPADRLHAAGRRPLHVRQLRSLFRRLLQRQLHCRRRRRNRHRARGSLGPHEMAGRRRAPPGRAFLRPLRRRQPDPYSRLGLADPADRRDAGVRRGRRPRAGRPV